jgi:hypothetical protein
VKSERKRKAKLQYDKCNDEDFDYNDIGKGGRRRASQRQGWNAQTKIRTATRTTMKMTTTMCPCITHEHLVV